MDRRQQVVERTRQVFGDRLDDVAHMVQQDRVGLRGWEEPAHVRAVLRRSIREGAGQVEDNVPLSVAESVETELGRRAGEPDRGQQREGLGQLLEAGATALGRVARERNPELSQDERLGLECVLLLYGRPALLLQDGRLEGIPAFWNILEDQREDVEMAQRGVGRIELLGHPEFDWAGTAFLVSDTTLLTTRRTADLFIEKRNDSWQFRPGISSWMNYRGDFQGLASAGYRIRGVIGVHELYDLAVLDVEPPQNRQPGSPMPLSVAAQPPVNLEGRPVYLVGYPVRDARRSEPELIGRIFRDVYNVKRVQPGQLRGCFPFNEIQLLRHDCSLLGQSAGACLIDLETHQVLGLHLTGRYLETSTAIPLWALRDDALLRRAGVLFAEASGRELDGTAQQLERLARTRYWPDVRDTIASLYQRAFGPQGQNR